MGRIFNLALSYLLFSFTFYYSNYGNIEQITQHSFSYLVNDIDSEEEDCLASPSQNISVPLMRTHHPVKFFSWILPQLFSVGLTLIILRVKRIFIFKRSCITLRNNMGRRAPPFLC